MRFLLLLALLPTLFPAQIVRKYSNEFLNLGVGARSMGMGNAVIASVQGIYAAYWNPAGLMEQEKEFEAAFMHAEYFAGIAKYDFLGGSKKLDSLSTLAVSFIRFGVDNIPNTLEMVDATGNVNYDRIKQFSVTDFAMFLSYTRKIPLLKGVMMGGNVKIIRRRIGDFGGSWGLGTDVGMKYRYKKWMLAAMGRDITSTFNIWTYSLTDKEKAVFEQTGNELPSNAMELTLPRLVLGASRTEMFWKERIAVTGEVNLINTFDGKRNTVLKTRLWSMEPAIGLELSYQKTFFVRMGVGNFQKQFDASGKKQITTFQPNAGVGLHYRMFTLDYAMTDIGDRSISIYSHIFSLKVELDRKK